MENNITLKNPVKTGEVFNSRKHTTTIDARIISTDKSVVKDFKLETSTMAFEQGVKSVKIKSIKYDDVTGASHDWTKHKIDYPIVVETNSGIVEKKSFKLNASGHYNMGYRDGLKEGHKIMKVTKEVDSDGHEFVRIWFNKKEYVDCVYGD